MSVIIRLQNLAWSANANDIREFFKGLTIPEGGVHIVGGEMGDAFIAFGTDEDARLAMMKSGESLKGVQITLQLSSRTQMQKVIETARQQALGLQNYVPPPQAATATPASHSQQPSFQQQAPASHMANSNQMMGQQTTGSHLPNDQNLNQSEMNQQPSVYPNQHLNLSPSTFNQAYTNQMPQFGANSYPLPNQMQQQGQQYPQSQMPMGMGQPQMNQMTSPFYAQMYQNQMGRQMPSHLKDQDPSQSPATSSSTNNLNNSPLNSTPTQAPAGASAETEDKKEKGPQTQHPQQPLHPKNDRRERDQKDDRRKRSKSTSRSKSRERDRRRRHRSRSRSRSRDRSNRRRKSRSRERERPRDRERDKERDRRERDSRNRNYRDRNDRTNQNDPEPKPFKQDNSGGIPGLGEIPDNIPREGLSIFSSVSDPAPQVSQNDAGWPTKDKEVPKPKPLPMDKSIEVKEPPFPHHNVPQPSIPDKSPAPVQPFNQAPNVQGMGNPQLPRFGDMNKELQMTNPLKEPFAQPMQGQMDPPYKEVKKPRLDDGQENRPLERNDWNDNRFGPPRENQEFKPPFNEEWPNQKGPDRRRNTRFDNREELEHVPPGPPGDLNRDFGPPGSGPDHDHWSGPGREPPHPPHGSPNRGRPWHPDRGGGRGERGGFDFKRGFRGGRYNYEGPGGKREMEMDNSGMPPDGPYNQKPPMEFGRGQSHPYEHGRPWTRGGSSRGRMNRYIGPDGREHKQKTCSIEILNLPNSTSYKAIKEAFSGIFIPHGSIKILTDDQGNRINVALLQLRNPSECFEAFKRNGSYINGSQVEINFIDDAIYDNAFDQSDRRDFGNRGKQPLDPSMSSCMYLSGLPLGTTEYDVINYLTELAINFKEVSIEYDSVLRKATGSCFLRLASPEETQFALRRVPSLAFNGHKLRIEICPEEAMNEYNRQRSFTREHGRQEGPFGRPGNDRREDFNRPNDDRRWHRPMNDGANDPNSFNPSFQPNNERTPFLRGNEERNIGDHVNERNEPHGRFNDGRRGANDDRRWPPNTERHGPMNYGHEDRHGPGEQFPLNDGRRGPPNLMDERFDNSPRNFGRRDDADFGNRKARPNDDLKQGKSFMQNPATSDLSVIYISNLPFGSTEQDIEKLLSDKSISASQVVLELEKGSRQPTGGFFIRMGSVDIAKRALRTLKGANLEGRCIKVELCPEEFIDKAIADKEKLKIFTKKPDSKATSQEKGPPKEKDMKPPLDKNPANEPPKKDQDRDRAAPKDNLQNKEIGHLGNISKNLEKSCELPYDTNLLTDSVVLKNVSKDVSPSNIRNFFTVDGLVPETIHFNPRNPKGECDVFVVFPLIENAKKALSKSGQRLGPMKAVLQLVSKPTVMAAMGKEFNPHELFQKQLPAQREKLENQNSQPKANLPHPRSEAHPDQDERRPEFFNDPNARVPGGPRRNDFSGRGGRAPVPSNPQAQIGTLVTPDSFGRPGCVVALGNVPFSASIDDILLFFRDFPSLSPECIIRRYDEKNRPTADARVSFNTPQEAIRALETLNGCYLMDRRIKLSPVN